jgi:hypothetical protein
VEVPLADAVEDADVAVNVTPYIIGFNKNPKKGGYLRHTTAAQSA